MTSETGPVPPRRFLTVEDVSESLRLEVSEVEHLLVSGELRGIRVGRDDAWRIEAIELDSFIDAKYEEARRLSLWNGHDFGSIADIDPRA
ncbi:helix-turn-helix domain-containing protein [Frondihabitans cladoniiphilus]|uniref:Helix-turn-helix domain-containing protein n=1 Tax=Frondihabitans cladoniiphilus TaxID=715785 RepID=A0ABP8WEU7_9MICO